MAQRRVSSSRRALRPRLVLETLERRDLLNATPTGTLLFQFTPDAGPQPDWLQQSALAQGLTVESPGIPNLYRLSGDNVTLNALASTYRHFSGVAYIEAEHMVSLALEPNDTYYASGQLYGMNGQFGIRANQAWDVTTGSTTVVIADIDTGIDYTHPDLYRNIWINQQEIPSAIRAALTDVDGDGIITFWDLNNPINIGPGKITDLNANGYIDAGDILNNASGWEDNIDADGNGYIDDLVGWDFVNNDNDPLDDHNHGTHVAGTMAGIGNNGTGVVGVNWKVQLMPLKFLNSSGNGSDANGAAAIRYAAAKGARVSNNSWGGGGFSQTLFEAIAFADTQNHVVVAAAGNSNNNNDTNPFYPASYNSGTYLGQPFTLQNLLAVAATDAQGNKASFSNYGATSVDLGAPGVGIISTVRNGGYASASGTSMAAPHVAGVVGLVLANEPGLTDNQLVTRVMSTARPLPALAGITVTGGLVNAVAAVTANSFRVSNSTPAGQTSAPVDRVTFTFSRAVQDGSFTLSDVVSFTGPNGPLTATAVNRISSTVYEVTFAAQSAPGSYSLVIGPDILDTLGRPMDQNGNGTAGEVPADRFTAQFNLPAPLLQRYDFGTPTSPLASGYTRVSEQTTYSAALGYGWLSGSVQSRDRGQGDDVARDFNFTTDATFVSDVANGSYLVTLTMGDAFSGHDQMGVFLEGIQVDSVTVVAGAPVTRTYAVTVSDGQLTLRLRDLGGVDANVVLNGLQVAAGAAPFRVSSSTPTGQITGSVDRVRLNFSADVQAGSFTLADVVSLTGPNGAITPTAVNAVSAAVYEVTFPAQSSPGTYTLVIGPDILNASGVAMDQNSNGTPGEVPGDRYTASFDLVSQLARRYDFGTADSPLASGYQRVSEQTAYSPATGYGWLSGSVQSRDRGQGDDLRRDFNFSSDATFALDVANGTYTVAVLMGDAFSGHDQMGVFLEGVQVDSVTTAAGQWVSRSYVVTVSDGQLTLRLRDLGGADANVVLNSLEVSAGSPSFRVASSTPTGEVAGPVDRVTLTFTAAVQQGSFTLEDVVSLTGPNGAITATGVNRLSATVYEVTFPAQSTAGAYTLVVGPAILDESGGALDQNGNGTPGEVPGDRYTASFSLQSSARDRFDFGTAGSPLAVGYRRVTEATTYSAQQGFGWLSGSVQSRDRGQGDDLRRDFNFSTDATFVVDMANGTYTVTLTMGDAFSGHDQMGVFLEGVQVDSVTTATNQWTTRSYTVTISDGQLTLRLRDLGGADANAVLNALEISAGSTSLQASSSISSGQEAGTGVTTGAPVEATASSAARSFGWLAGSLQSGEDGLARDFNFSGNARDVVREDDPRNAFPEGGRLDPVTVGPAGWATDSTIPREGQAATGLLDEVFGTFDLNVLP